MPRDERWTAAISGCGIIAGGKDSPSADGPARTHAQALHRHGGFRLTAVSDPDVQRRERFRETWGADHAYGDTGEMLQAHRPDLLVIASPNEQHFPQLSAALQSASPPRAILVEKPVCLRRPELETLLRLQGEAHSLVLVNHTRRFDAAHRRAAELIGDGRFGPLVRGSAVCYGGWLHNGVHLVDTLNLLLGEPPEVVGAAALPHGKPGDPDLQVELRYGAAPVLLDAFDESFYQLFEMELLFEAGRVRIHDFGSEIHLEGVEVNAIGERELKPLPGSPMRGLVSPLPQAVNTIGDHLRGSDVTTDSDLRHAADTMRTLWDAHELATNDKDLSHAQE